MSEQLLGMATGFTDTEFRHDDGVGGEEFKAPYPSLSGNSCIVLPVILSEPEDLKIKSLRQLPGTITKAATEAIPVTEGPG